MKVAMYGHKHYPTREGGVEVAVSNLAPAVADDGIDVTIISRKEPDYHPAPTDEKVKEEFAPTFRDRRLNAFVASLTGAVRAAAGPCDVVHVHAEGMAGFCWIPKLFGKKVVMTVHGVNWKYEKWTGFAKKYMRFSEKVGARFSDAIVVLTEDDKEYFHDEYGRGAYVIPNGVNPPPVQSPEIEEAKLKELGLKKGGYFLFMGRISKEKHVLELLDAFRKADVKQTLVIAGDGDSDYGRMLAEEAKGMNVVFTGFADRELAGILYGGCRAFILPSPREGLSIGIMEAMALGIPIIASDIPANRPLLSKYGGLFGTQEELVRLISEKGKAPFERNREMSHEMMVKYSWKRVAKATEKIYAKLQDA